jgi:hypothetical protein
LSRIKYAIYASFLAIVLTGNLFASQSSTDDFEAPSTPVSNGKHPLKEINDVSADEEDDLFSAKKARRSTRLASRSIETMEDVYALEAELISTFKEFRDTHDNENRETLGECFKLLEKTPRFQANYFKVVQEGHHFYLPSIFRGITDENQIERMYSGKAFVSPVQSNAFQGHHIQMRPPVGNKPAFIWVLTRTSHKEFSKELHIDVEESAIDRNEFKRVQKAVYKSLGIEMIEKMKKSPKKAKLKKARRAILLTRE